MAFTIKASTLSLPTSSPVAAFRARPGARVGRSILRVQANVTWQLVPDKKWALSNPEAADKLKPVDLTEGIGQKEEATVGGEKEDAVRDAAHASRQPCFLGQCLRTLGSASMPAAPCVCFCACTTPPTS